MDDHYRGKDVAFVGDKTSVTLPTPVLLSPELPWKWVTKKLGLDDIGPLDQFYAAAGNDNKLYPPVPPAGDQNVTLPRLLVLPPQFINFCVSGQRTPYQFHKYLSLAATALGSPVTIPECQLMLDWCIMASHHDTHTSVLAFSLEAAFSTDEAFNKWVQRRLNQTLGPDGGSRASMHAYPQPSHPASQPFNIPPGVPPPPAQYQMPSPNLWAQFAANLTHGLAAALQPMATALAASEGGVASAYEDGGRNYDKYQLAVVRGFSHTHEFSGIQQFWALFQTTKHTETHRNNIKRKMARWANAQRPPISIDRNLYITNATLKDILALRFNPGNSTADLETAEEGISILICRPRSMESKSAQRRKELIEGRASKTYLSLTDAEKLFMASEPTVCPEDYNALTKCMGTYCALLHILFGSKCVFFKHCMELVHVLTSD